jgi:hypothetical protein
VLAPRARTTGTTAEATSATGAAAAAAPPAVEVAAEREHGRRDQRYATMNGIHH